MDQSIISWIELYDMTFEERCVVIRIGLNGEKVDDDFLIGMSESFNDKDLLKYVLDNHFEGVLSEEVMESIATEFSDIDLMKYVLEHYHGSENVSEDFIRAMIDEFDDAYFTKYLLSNYYQISTEEKATIAKYNTEEVKVYPEAEDTISITYEKKEDVQKAPEQDLVLESQDGPANDLAIYDNPILRVLAYIACGFLFLVRVARYSSLMVVVSDSILKLVVFLKKGKRSLRKAPSRIPRKYRQFLIRLGINVGRFAVLSIIYVLYIPAMSWIILYILVLWVIDWFLSGYAEGEIGRLIDEALWVAVLDV